MFVKVYSILLLAISAASTTYTCKPAWSVSLHPHCLGKQTQTNLIWRHKISLSFCNIIFSSVVSEASNRSMCCPFRQQLSRLISFIRSQDGPLLTPINPIFHYANLLTEIERHWLVIYHRNFSLFNSLWTGGLLSHRVGHRSCQQADLLLPLLGTDGDFCQRVGHRNCRNILTWPFIGKLWRSTFWRYH
jgi:hypothetical protein